jgi:hypothetical protein
MQAKILGVVLGGLIPPNNPLFFLIQALPRQLDKKSMERENT